MGRLRPIKGQDRFLRIAARIAQKNTAVRFIIVGGDNFEVADLYANEVKQLPKTLGIEDLVTFTGHLDDVRPALAGMDIFVNPGDPETFGLVNLEAMAMGIPVVAFDHAALPEIVEHGVSGLLVPSGNEHMLEAAITRLIEQPALATEMGRAGRTRVEQFFTAERMAAEIQAIWEEVLG